MKTHTNSAQDNKREAYLAWGAVSIFYLYQYFLRVSPGVMIEEIRTDFALTAEEFATLGAYYLYAYAFLQIPMGIIVDKFGVKITVITSILLCISGGLIMSFTEVFALAQISRILIGAGSAAGFMCSLKVIADSLPAGKRGFLMGATLTLGMLGALTAGKPQVLLVQEYGWRNVLTAVSISGLLCLLLILFLVPNKRKDKHERETLSAVGHSILDIIKNKRVMLYAILAVGLYTPFCALADLWGPIFVATKYQLSKVDSSQTSMMMYVGLGAGSLLLPWLCERYRILDRAIQLCIVGILLAFAFVLYGNVVGMGMLTLVLVLLGLFCGAEMMCFTGAVNSTSPNNSGVTIGVVNTLNMLGGAFLDQIVGYSLDKQWSGALTETGIRAYSPLQYVKALSILVIVIAICSLASIRLNYYRKKHGKL